MNKHPLAAAGLSLALTGIVSCEAVLPQAEPPEAHCQTVAPCTVPQFVPSPTDGPESNTEATAPAAETDIVILSGAPTFGFGEAGDRLGFGLGPFFEASLWPLTRREGAPAIGS